MRNEIRTHKQLVISIDFEIVIHGIVITITRHGRVVEHTVHFTVGLLKRIIPCETDEDDEIVEIAMVGILIAHALATAGLYRLHHGIIAAMPLTFRDTSIRNEPDLSRIDRTRHKFGGHHLPVFSLPINKIACRRILHDRIAVSIMQIVVKLIARGKAMQGVAIRLYKRLRNIRHVGSLQSDRNHQ